MIGKRKVSRALIIGASGFIGSNLVKYLLEKGYSVNAIIGGHGLQYLDGINDSRLRIHTYNEAEGNLNKLGKFKFLFNLSGYVNIKESFVDPLKYELNKPIATIKLIENCRAGKIINISTANVYDFINNPLSEKSPVGPVSPYAVSQLSADYYTQILCSYHKIPYLISRIFNPYGPPNRSRGVIATIINELRMGKHVTLYNPRRRFDFTYIDDVVEAIYFGAFKVEGIINIGCAQAVSLLEVYRKICFLLYGNYLEPHLVVSDKYREEVFSNNRKLKMAGFKFKYGIDEGLRRIVRYFQESE